MKYLCLAYEEESALDALSPEEWDALRRETLAYVETLPDTGHLVVTAAAGGMTGGRVVIVRVRALCRLSPRYRAYAPTPLDAGSLAAAPLDHRPGIEPALGRWKMIDNLRRSLFAPRSTLSHPLHRMTVTESAGPT